MPLSRGRTLADIDLGSVDAEADRRLSEYFVKTPYVESALAVRRSHYLGRKGSGKSALFSQLARLFQEKGIRTQVLQLTPDQYAWNALRQPFAARLVQRNVDDYQTAEATAANVTA